jgi:hypothetical protein
MGRKPVIRRLPPPRRIPPPPPPRRIPPPPPPRKNILSNIKKAVSTVYKKTGLSKVVSTVGRKTGITNVVNSSKNAENLKKCNTNLNNLRNDYNNIINKQTSLNQQYSALKNKQEQLRRDYNSKVNELKLKETQYNNLLNEYNIQVKDKQGLMDYLTVNEHFSNFSNIEGLTSQEGNAVVKITNGLDYNFYNSIVNQNSQLDYETQKYKNIYSTDQQKSNYQSQQLDVLNTWNSYLFIIYYVFVLILCYFLYYSNTLLNYMKVSILLSLLLYPFIINTIETNLYNAIRYTFAIINGNVYTN